MTMNEPMALRQELERVKEQRDLYRKALESIKRDCLRGAHMLGMTPAGVQDFVDRINRTLNTE